MPETPFDNVEAAHEYVGLLLDIGQARTEVAHDLEQARRRAPPDRWRPCSSWRSSSSASSRTSAPVAPSERACGACAHSCWARERRRSRGPEGRVSFAVRDRQGAPSRSRRSRRTARRQRGTSIVSGPLRPAVSRRRTTTPCDRGVVRRLQGEDDRAGGVDAGPGAGGAREPAALASIGIATERLHANASAPS